MVYLDEQVIRMLYDAFNRREFEAVLKLYADDVLLFCPGRNRVSGEYHGHQGVLDFWNRQVELTGGTFHPQVLAAVESDEHIVLVTEVSLERGGTKFGWKRVLHFKMYKNRVKECWIYEGDQYTADEAYA